MWPFSKRVPIKKQLERLRDAGILVNDGVSEADLISFEPKAELEEKPFHGLIAALGADIEREPFTPVADRLWMCDYERIEDDGAYRDVILRLERMTGGALGLDQVIDHVDLEQGEAWVEFLFHGETVRWDFEVEDDWLDPAVLVQYDALLEKAGSSLRIYSNHTDYGQVALVGAFRRDEKRAFDALTSIRMPPIAEQTR